MPKSVEIRDMIRRTYFRADIWEGLGFAIKIVFIIASKDDGLADEITKFDDILHLDFEERHTVVNPQARLVRQGFKLKQPGLGRI